MNSNEEKHNGDLPFLFLFLNTLLTVESTAKNFQKIPGAP